MATQEMGPYITELREQLSAAIKRVADLERYRDVLSWHIRCLCFDCQMPPQDYAKWQHHRANHNDYCDCYYCIWMEEAAPKWRKWPHISVCHALPQPQS